MTTDRKRCSVCGGDHIICTMESQLQAERQARQEAEKERDTLKAELDKARGALERARDGETCPGCGLSSKWGHDTTGCYIVEAVLVQFQLLAPKRDTISSIDQTCSVTPALTAGVQRIA